MKKVQYDGEDTRVMPSIGAIVTKGDIVEVDDDFAEFNFSDTVLPVSVKVIVPPTEIPAIAVVDEVVDTKDAGATDEKIVVASTDKLLVADDAEKGV